MSDSLTPTPDFPTKHTITIKIEITEQMLHDNVVSSIEGGSGYWVTEINTGKPQPHYAHYFTAKFKEMDTGKVHQLSIPKLLTGLQILAQKYPWHFVNIMAERGDATTGDVLVQCALLGDIVYG